MRTAAEFGAARRRRSICAGGGDVREVEVFAAANGQSADRLNYTSHIPCNWACEEPKSVESYGLGIQAVFDTRPDAVARLRERAERLGVARRRAVRWPRRGSAAVVGPEFVSLPQAVAARRGRWTDFHDPDLMASPTSAWSSPAGRS
jgi:hypothetical protein